MSDPADVWAIIPIKETHDAKQRLASVLSAPLRQALALAMLEDVLEAVTNVTGLGGVILVTVDPLAIVLAHRYGAKTIKDGAYGGHTGAVTAGARYLIAHGRSTMLTLPGDLPLVTAAEIEQLIAAHRPAPAFTIAPAHDDQGSNAILMSPPDAVSLRFGEDSFFPHLSAARASGIEPCVVRLPGIASDIDNPQDLDHFARLGTRTRAGRLVAENVGERLG
jgi:2-phospho-L-lactate/phosphoenolpyruvate guanylyltransferase